MKTEALTNAERQRRYREKRKSNEGTALHVWLPCETMADLQLLAKHNETTQEGMICILIRDALNRSEA